MPEGKYLGSPPQHCFVHTQTHTLTERETIALIANEDSNMFISTHKTTDCRKILSESAYPVLLIRINVSHSLRQFDWFFLSPLSVCFFICALVPMANLFLLRPCWFDLNLRPRHFWFWTCALVVFDFWSCALVDLILNHCALESQKYWHNRVPRKEWR